MFEQLTYGEVNELARTLYRATLRACDASLEAVSDDAKWLKASGLHTEICELHGDLCREHAKRCDDV